MEDKYQSEVRKNFEWFNKNRKKIIKENEEKIGYFVVMKNQEIVGFYHHREDALIEAHNKFGNEPYSIQQLEEKNTIHNLGFIGLKHA